MRLFKYPTFSVERTSVRKRTYKSKTSFQILLRQTTSATLRWRIYVVILIISTKIIWLYSHIDAAPQFL